MDPPKMDQFVVCHVESIQIGLIYNSFWLCYTTNLDLKKRTKNNNGLVVPSQGFLDGCREVKRIELERRRHRGAGASLVESDRLDRLLSVQEVAQRFGVPVSWVYAKAEDGTLPSYKIGHYRRFRLSEIDEFLCRCRCGLRGDD